MYQYQLLIYTNIVFLTNIPYAGLEKNILSIPVMQCNNGKNYTCNFAGKEPPAEQHDIYTGFPRTHPPHTPLPYLDANKALRAIVSTTVIS